MPLPLTIYGELTLPSTVLADGRTAAEVESWLRYHSLLPPHVQGCRWRLAADRVGYILSYEVAVPQEEPS